MNDGPIPPEPKRSDYVNNPFGTNVAEVRTLGALANAEQQRAIAEVQARMIIARANPRNEMRAMDLILRDCTRPSLAKSGLYAYPKGGTTVEGPSIRLAEAMAQRWGNIASGIKEISRANGYSECVAYAWDLETGYYDERQFQIKHWIDSRSGGRATTDEREIYELVANMGQRRKRAVLLTVMPGDVQEAAVAQCVATLHTDADTSPEALKRLVEAFKGFGVSQAQIEKRCLCRLEALRPAQIVQLRNIYASLRDEMSVAGDWFEAGVWTEVAARHAESAETGQSTGARRGRPPGSKNTETKPAETDPERVDRQVAEMQERKADAPAHDAAQAVAAVAATQQTQPKQDAAPAASTAQTQTGFSAWLVDGEGDIIAADDGQGGKYTDPVMFARALADLKASTFPADWPAIELANREDADRAALADAEAQTILKAMDAPAIGPAVNIAPNAPIPASDHVEPVATGVPVGNDLLGDLAPVDPLAVMAPAKEAKADWERYAESAKVTLASCSSIGMIDHFVTVNEAIYKAFPNKHRLNVLAMIDARKKELAPPPAQNAIVTARQIGDALKSDVDKCATGDDLMVLSNNGVVKSRMADLKVKDATIYAEVAAYARAKLDELKAKAST